MLFELARSAIVRETFKIRSCARAESFNFVIALIKIRSSAPPKPQCCFISFGVIRALHDFGVP